MNLAVHHFHPAIFAFRPLPPCLSCRYTFFNPGGLKPNKNFGLGERKIGKSYLFHLMAIRCFFPNFRDRMFFIKIYTYYFIYTFGTTIVHIFKSCKIVLCICFCIAPHNSLRFRPNYEDLLTGTKAEATFAQNIHIQL